MEVACEDIGDEDLELPDDLAPVSDELFTIKTDGDDESIEDMC